MRDTLMLLRGLALAGLLAPSQAGAQGAARVDESALRYYASTGQAERAQAETRRLRALYPGWTPPDLSETAATGGADEDDLWDLFAADKLKELQDAIAARRVAEPGWEPSADLRGKLRLKLFRAHVLGLAREGRYADIVRELKSGGEKIDGADVETLWAVADAWRATRQNGQALAIYKTILKDNSEPGPRLATVQKALAGLRMDEAEQLIAMAKPGELAPIAVDIARARIAAFLHDERKQDVGADDLKLFADFAKSETGLKDPDQPALLGWRSYKLKDYKQALDWFKLSLEHGGGAMVAHGLAHSLRFLGLKREAEEVAYAWREPLVNNSILFIDILERDLTKPIPPYIEPDRLARYGEVAMQTASGEGAQALGWYAYNSCQYQVALQWFERAVAWHPKEATVYGLALTLGRLKQEKAEMQWINRYDGLFPLPVEIIFPLTAKPPTPCDAPRGAYAARRGGEKTNFDAAQGVGRYVSDPERHYAWGRVPPPGFAGPAGVAGGGPRPARGAFPIAVAAENPLRFAPAGQGAPPGAGGAPTSGGYAQDRWQKSFPLVARRVPGVGAMPYERYGYALLPGYNGVLTSSSPTASDQIAPAGTLWAKEPPDTLASGASGAAARDPDPHPPTDPRASAYARTAVPLFGSD
jgi:tetratricopeptide (TPR) repeat protein